MTDFKYYKLGGSLEYQHPTYVVRQADSELYEGLINGELCYVLNSRQMGKSSLRVHIMKRLKEQGIQCASVDLTRIGSHVTPAEWYGGFVSEVLRGFGLSRKVNFGTWWRSHEFLPPKQRLSELIDDLLLTEFSGNLIIFIDEVDSILRISFKDDFFAFIRACYNYRADNPEYQRLTFCLLGVATPANLIGDKNRTPFNIGRAIELTGFQLDEVAVLIRGLEGIVARPQAIIEEVLKWTGGQPFLTQKLCQLICNSADSFPAHQEEECVERLVQTQIIQNWEAQDEPEHLRTIRDRILQSSQNQTGRLLGLYQQILQQGEIPADDSPEQTQLRLTGLIVKQQGKLRIYNDIYAQIFNRAWLDKVLTNIRPYAQTLNAWVDSHFQDESRLLRGQTLQDARNWAIDKGLSDLDRKFLDASQELEKRDVQKRLQAEAEATQILIQANEVLLAANQKAKRRIQIGGGVLAIALILAVFAGLWTSRIIKQAQLEKIKSSSLFATALFVSNQKFDALLEALKAAKQIKSTHGVDRATQIQVLEILQRTVNFTRERNRLEGFKAAIRGVNFSPDGNFLATVSEDKSIKIWRSDGKLFQVFARQQNAILALSFSPDGKLLSTVDETGAVKLWNWQDGILLQTLKTEGKNVWNASINFSPDGENIAAIDDSNETINIWSKNQNWKLTKNIKDAETNILYVNYLPSNSSDEQLLASANKDGTVKIWRSKDATLLKTINAHNQAVLHISFSEDGQFLATASEDTTVKIWRTADWQLVKTLTSHGDWVNSVSFSQDGKLLATASDDNTVKIWRRSDWRLLESLAGHNNKVYSINFSPNSHTLASAGEDKKVIFWSFHEHLLKIITDHSDVIRKMSVSHDGKIVATASNDRTVKLWSSLDGKLLQTLKHENAVEGVSFSHNNEFLSSASVDGIIKFWRISNGKLLNEWKDSNVIFDISFIPNIYNDQFLASVGVDRVIKLWKTSDGKLLQILQGHNDKILSVSFSSNGKILASGSKDGIIKLWIKSKDWQLFKTLDSHNSAVQDVKFSPDGMFLASASVDGTVKLWKTTDGTLLKSLSTHQGHVLSVSFSPNSQLLASGGEDGIIKLWQISNGSLHYSLHGHKSAIRKVNFIKNNILVSVSAGLEKTVILWNLQDIELDKLLKNGCNWVRDYLNNNPSVNKTNKHICNER
ncbi:AAA-like domain-containing protein [Dendronalium sp. ChiSLP03b]|uniref:WD40 domain-containing protein n=1 Tax=Dendronalium sp. ChiSLP03b TaxID=3075381 RepID=UPI002AD24276|nr:AAA-like domain-containing protein [Dendronalium sp. ChiSLP03b]MDZ8206806.1 AAA-like domain-containing protein [Dendronalium sp. ChiSLP03b]